MPRKPRSELTATYQLKPVRKMVSPRGSILGTAAAYSFQDCRCISSRVIFHWVAALLKWVRMSVWAMDPGLTGTVRLRMYAPKRLWLKTHPATEPDPWLINGLLYFMLRVYQRWGA